MVIFARCDKVLVIMENNPYQLERLPTMSICGWNDLTTEIDFKIFLKKKCVCVCGGAGYRWNKIGEIVRIKAGLGYTSSLYCPLNKQ